MGEERPYRFGPDATQHDQPPSPHDQTPAAGYFRGVARVPHTPVLRRDHDTDELPAIHDRADPPRSSLDTLRRGGGWTMAGLWFAVVCWGIWALVDRDLVGAGFALGLVLATAALVFTVSRLLGRAVLENVLGRPRRSAWPSHLATFLLLVIGGVAFLQQTSWVVHAWSWIVERLV